MMQVNKAWKRNLVRRTTQGRPLTESLSLMRVGRSRYNQEIRLDDNFAREMDDALAHAADKRASTA